MKIQKLTLEGFRGFKDKTEFDLHPNVNVFVGVNGSGKTSVLDAASMLLGEYVNILFNRFEENEKSGFSNNDLSIGLSNNRISLNINNIKDHKESLEVIMIGEIGDKNENDTDSNSRKVDTRRYLNRPEVFERRSPLCMISKYLMNPKISESYDSRFSPNELYNFDKKKFITYSNFNDLVEWFIYEENNENRIKLRNDSNYKSPTLAPIRYALDKFLVALSSARYSKLHVDTVDGFKPTLFIKKDDLFFKLIDLSEGEKILILLVSDIAKKLTMINKEYIKPEEILNQYGIVLIDEIETHLHPAWQRDIIPALTHVFPNVQFLVTTHSPQVLSNVRKECVHMIKDFKRIPFTPSIYGADSNMILWDIFGVKKRPKHADEKFREYYRALEKEDRDTALKLLEGLQKHFGEDRLDVQKAKTAFEFEYDEYLPEV